MRVNANECKSEWTNIDPARITEISKDQTVSEYDTLVLECKLEGNPIHAGNVKWLKGGQELLATTGRVGALTGYDEEEFDEDRREVTLQWDTQLKKSILLIRKVSKDDGGSYECLAENGLAPPVSELSNVVIHCMKH